jgi:hypothetical protein
MYKYRYIYIVGVGVYVCVFILKQKLETVIRCCYTFV